METKLVVNPNTVLREEEDGCANLCDPDSGRIRILNLTAVAIWKLMDGQRTLAEEDLAAEGLSFCRRDRASAPPCGARIGSDFVPPEQNAPCRQGAGLESAVSSRPDQGRVVRQGPPGRRYPGEACCFAAPRRCREKVALVPQDSQATVEYAPTLLNDIFPDSTLGI